MPRILLAAALVAATLTAPSAASADFGEGAIHLGAGPTLLSVEHLPEPDAQIITYGIPPLSYLHGFRFGYMLTAQIYLGLQFALGGATFSSGSGFGGFSADTLYFLGLPRFLFFISLASALNLYLGAEVGVAIQGDPDGNPDDIFKAGAIAGISFLATQSFSIDGELGMAFTHHPDSANAGFQVGLTLIFSGWLGGSGSSSGGDDGGFESEPEPAPAPTPLPANPEGGYQ